MFLYGRPNSARYSRLRDNESLRRNTMADRKTVGVKRHKTIAAFPAEAQWRLCTFDINPCAHRILRSQCICTKAFARPLPSRKRRTRWNPNEPGVGPLAAWQWSGGLLHNLPRDRGKSPGKDGRRETAHNCRIPILGIEALRLTKRSISLRVVRSDEIA